MRSPTACTIVSNNYLAFARVFARSLLEHHPDADVHVLIVDRRDPRIDYGAEPFSVTFAEELPIPNRLSFCFRYSILELNTAVKPYFLEHLRERTGRASLCYFDPDILITGDLSELYALLDDSDIVLTPHILEPIDDDGQPGERDFLLSGTYNLGFLGMSFNPATARFLDWWQKRLYRYCFHQVDAGLFVDQRWMDLSPAFLPRATILRDPGYNVAYWNAMHREVREVDGGFRVGDRPLRFFHFSGFDAGKIEAVSKHQNRFTLAERPDLEPLFVHYRDRLLGEGHERLRDLPYRFGSFANGVPVHPLARRLLHDEDPDGERWPDPFAVGSGESFYDWLREPEHPELPLPISRLALALWSRRDDVRRAFPDPAEDPAPYTRWLGAHGARDNGVPEPFVAPLRNATRQAARRLLPLGRAPLRFTNGVLVPRVAREALLREDPFGKRWPDPLVAEREDSFYTWLTEPIAPAAVPGAEVQWPRIAFLFWERITEAGSASTTHPDRLCCDDGCSDAEAADLDAVLLETIREAFRSAWESRLENLVATAPEPAALGDLLARSSLKEIEWLLQDVSPGRPRIPRLATQIHADRPDLQESFPDPLGTSRSGFARWYVLSGRREYHLPEVTVEPVARSLGFLDRLRERLRRRPFAD